jgi:hypothetical protein
MSKKKPKTTEPKPIPDFPPTYGAATPLIVGPTDNWWTLTRKIGRINPWELIQYNFQTTNPDEVNWCMRNILKCTLTTKDCLNYRFGGKEDGTPIKIYVPGLDWTSPKPLPPGGVIPDRPAEDSTDKLANTFVRFVLRDPRIGFINFGLTGYWIYSGLFDAVRERIEAGGIAVYSKPSTGTAEYDSYINALFVPLENSITARALIIHECVHAGLDILKAKKIRVVDDESLAYIAQSIYAIKNKTSNPEIRILGSEDYNMNEVFKHAWDLALRLLAGERPANSDFDPLRQAILSTPKYGHAYNHANYDGVAW